ncbi:MAG TPA: helix-turn-helix domain-containing protein [Candidatus Dormibacteraeota bacterium]|nr:helix-turn-helix domain-containing protein [Candidatus Dormibacteraeota bacterium]
MKRADLLLHPVRLRLLLAFANDRRLTPKQASAALRDVPQATVYRQIERLHRGGALEVVAERRIRGAVERTFAIAAGGGLLSPDDLARMSRDEQLGYFQAFLAGLIDQFDKYLERPDIDLVRDGAGYSAVVLNLTDDEFIEMAKAMNLALRPYLTREARPDRKRRVLATVLVPVNESEGEK